MKAKVVGFFGPMVMRILNMNATFLIVIGVLIRFSYFKAISVNQEVSVETGEVDADGNPILETEKKEFWEKQYLFFYFNTIFIFPPLIALLILMEFKVKHASLGKYFNFLDSYLGKGFYILMLALMILEKTTTVEWIFALANTCIAILNIVVHFMQPPKPVVKNHKLAPKS